MYIITEFRVVFLFFMRWAWLVLAAVKCMCMVPSCLCIFFWSVKHCLHRNVTVKCLYCWSASRHSCDTSQQRYIEVSWIPNAFRLSGSFLSYHQLGARRVAEAVISDRLESKFSLLMISSCIKRWIISDIVSCSFFNTFFSHSQADLMLFLLQG